MGLHPGTRSGRAKGSLLEFRTPMGSPPIVIVVGTPSFHLKMPPTCQPPSMVPATPPIEWGVGTCQRPLSTNVCRTLKSAAALLILGSNQNQVVTEFWNESPAMVDE